jgi:hypothetical protein
MEEKEIKNNLEKTQKLIDKSDKLDKVLAKSKLLLAENLELRNRVEQKKWESAYSLFFTFLRAVITCLILFIFIIIDLNILWAIKDFDIKTIFEFSPEQLSIIKYGIGFLMLQVLVFSQKFGFSNIINTINMLRGKKTND